MIAQTVRRQHLRMVRYPHNRHIRTRIRTLDCAVRKMLHLQTTVQPVVEHIADAEVITKLEGC